MKKEEALTYQFRTTANTINRSLDAMISQNNIQGLTGVQGWVMWYLVRNAGKKIYQKEIEEDLCMQRSTTSRMLQSMEKNGFITRVGVPQDRRLKQVLPTEKLLKIHGEILTQLEKMEDKLREALSPDEVESLLKICGKINRTLEQTFAEMKS